jgi:SAM-dependent methyltransferase
MDSRWKNTRAYERYMGRWSTPAGERFLAWLQPPPGLAWLDVGCGTGALTKIILQTYQPQQVLGIDASDGFMAHARGSIPDGRAHFQVSLAQAIGLKTGSVDAVVCGLVLNCIPDPAQAMREIKRLCRPGGVIGLFVWDYAGGMQMIRHFWDAAIALDEGARRLDQGAGSPLLALSGKRN